MNGFALPLDITPSGLKRETSLKASIDRNIEQIISTPLYSCVSNPLFGFIFNNLRFEILSEKEGVVLGGGDNGDTFDLKSIYGKKVSGSSKNEDTFAYELMLAIERNDPRLTDVRTSMTYVRDEKTIYINIKGTVRNSDEPYNYSTMLKVWN